MSRFIVESGFAFTQECIQLFEETIEDWIHAVPEANDFLRNCQHFSCIIQPEIPSGDVVLQDVSAEEVTEAPGREQDTPRPSLRRTNSGDTTFTRKQDRMKSWICQPIEYYQSNRLKRAKDRDNTKWDKETVIIREIVQRISIGKKFLTQFMEDDDRKETFQESMNWSVQRKSQARDLREYFQDESNLIRSRLNELVVLQSSNGQESSLKVDHFKRDMTNSTYTFWNRLFGQSISADIQQLIDAYNLLFGELDPSDQEYIEKALGSEVTIFGFINLTNKHGFPFQKNITFTTRESQSVKSDEQRVDTIKMAIELVTEFSSTEIRNSLIRIYTWFKECSKEEHRERRATDWGERMLYIREMKYPREKPISMLEAEELDLGRRTICLFYQRFMMVWRFDTVTRDAFDGAKFPGKGRVMDFLCYVELLDRVNFTTVMGKNSDLWEEDRPEVYKFMKTYLDLVAQK